MSGPERFPAHDIARLARRLVDASGTGRILVALAGAPGSGKSTLAERLAAYINASDPGRAAVLAMDGYHLDDAILHARGMRERKGAPDTFDVAGLQAMLSRLSSNTDPEIFVPVFDRSAECARAGARVIEKGVRIVLVEGNYLLCRMAPWQSLHRYFGRAVLLSVPEAELRRRLAARWRGFGLSAAEIERKVEGNDLPNGRFVIKNSITPDFIVDHAPAAKEESV